MSRIWLLLLLIASTSAQAKEKSYETGKLLEIAPSYLEIMKMPITVAYTFKIQSGDLIYSGSCSAREFKPQDWIINDPIQFRLHSGLLIVKRANGKELKLALQKKARIDSPSP